jgi:two-component sensor histidine kinase
MRVAWVEETARGSAQRPGVSLSVSPGFVLNDPEHVRPAGATWLRGITPLRLAALAAACTMVAARPTLWNITPENALAALGKLLSFTALYFVFALPLFILVAKTDIWTARSTTRVRIAALVLAVCAGACAFVAGELAYREVVNAGNAVDPLLWQTVLAFGFRALAMGGLFAAILFFATRERNAQRSLRSAQRARIEIESQIVESRLQLLQAQIEPHFLFNSLASVKRLYEREPAKGRQLMRDLGDYLRVASRRARQREIRLAEEIALARSFLAIFQVRMGGRLRLRIDVPPELESAAVPPLMVGTLVENAIKHGISPRASGGTLSLSARRQGESLEIQVEDDGVGFRARSGHGVGLANIRARLETLFAGAGTLELTANAGRGVSAILRIPYQVLS